MILVVRVNGLVDDTSSQGKWSQKLRTKRCMSKVTPIVEVNSVYNRLRTILPCWECIPVVRTWYLHQQNAIMSVIIDTNLVINLFFVVIYVLYW